jgi:hypothetical protein
VDGMRVQYEKMVSDLMKQQNTLKTAQLELQKKLKEAEVRRLLPCVQSKHI